MLLLVSFLHLPENSSTEKDLMFTRQEEEEEERVKKEKIKFGSFSRFNYFV